MQSFAPTIDTCEELSANRRIYYDVKRVVSPAQQWALFSLALVGTDVIMVVLAFWVTYAVRFSLKLPFFYNASGTGLDGHYSLLIAGFIPVWLIISVATGLYNRHNLLGGTVEYGAIFRATTWVVLLMVLVEFMNPGLVIARGWLLVAWVSVFVFVSLGRFGMRRVVYFLRHRGYFLSPTVIVGSNAEGQMLAQQLLTWKASGLHLVGFVDKKTPVGTPVFGDLCVLGDVEGLGQIISQYGVEELILSSSAVSCRDNLVEIFRHYGMAEGINVRMSSGLYEIITTGLTVKEFAYVPLVGVNKVRLTGVDQMLKRCLDVLLGLVALAIVWPVMLLIAIVIKLDSPGPIFHRRRVMGVNGQQFDALKFRTMYVNGDAILAENEAAKAELAKNHKLKHDPRITRAGRFLRKYSLDELPQIFNVLRGQMSLVGPRMISPAEMVQYQQWGINLLTIPPGITGLWQVSGRSDVSYDERVRMDMYYIRNWTIWFDLQLILHTIPAVLMGRGAY